MLIKDKFPSLARLPLITPSVWERSVPSVEGPGVRGGLGRGPIRQTLPRSPAPTVIHRRPIASSLSDRLRTRGREGTGRVWYRHARARILLHLVSRARMNPAASAQPLANLPETDHNTLRHLGNSSESKNYVQSCHLTADSRKFKSLFWLRFARMEQNI